MGVMKSCSAFNAVLFSERIDKISQQFIRIYALFVINFRKSNDEFSRFNAGSVRAGSKKVIAVLLC